MQGRLGGVDGWTEGPDRSAEGVGPGGAVAPPQYGVWGHAPRKIKISTLKSRILVFLQTEMVSSAMATMQD